MALANELKTLLADTVVLYTRAHGHHWNVEGADFREYHGLFAEIYADVYGSIDAIAENIRKLGDYAPYRLERFAELATLSDSRTDSTDALSMARDLLSGNAEYLVRLKKCFKVATTEDEQGIANYIAERIDAHQKHGWVLRASLKV